MSKIFYDTNVQLDILKLRIIEYPCWLNDINKTYSDRCYYYGRIIDYWIANSEKYVYTFNKDKDNDNITIRYGATEDEIKLLNALKNMVTLIVDGWEYNNFKSSLMNCTNVELLKDIYRLLYDKNLF